MSNVSWQTLSKPAAYMCKACMCSVETVHGIWLTPSLPASDYRRLWMNNSVRVCVLEADTLSIYLPLETLGIDEIKTKVVVFSLL